MAPAKEAPAAKAASFILTSGTPMAMAASLILADGGPGAADLGIFQAAGDDYDDHDDHQRQQVEQHVVNGCDIGRVADQPAEDVVEAVHDERRQVGAGSG